MTSRRDFLKKAGLLSAAFAVPALNVNGDTPQSKIRLKNT
ncbi:twin-arginine translocation signal domain-containing protein, partial [Bacteroides xylanisolvens]